MKLILLSALLGLGSGALIAGIAIGLVATYRGSGIINLATGAAAMISGYAFWGFRTGAFGLTVSTPLSCVLAIVAVLILGALMEVLAFRPLRTATPVAKVVASLGILLVLQAAMQLAFGNTPKQAPSLLPTTTVATLGGALPIAGPIAAGVVIVMAAAVAVLYRWTNFGLATRAAAENEVSGMLVGLTPNSLAMANTLLACLVVGILGILVGPLTSLDPVQLPLLVIPALAAAVFAGFTSVGVACAAGIAIGVLENLLYYASVQSWFPTDMGVPLPGIEEMLEFLLVVIAMFVRGARLPGRHEIVEKRLPAVPIPERVLRPAGLMTVIVVAALIVLPYDFRNAIVITEVAAILMLSVVVITGFVGQVSVVQLSLAGVAGFTMAHLSSAWHLGFPIGPLVGVVGATLVGLLVGVSALRVRGVQLAVVTLAAAVAIQQFWFANSTWGASEVGDPVSSPQLFGLNLGNDAPFRGLDGKIPSPMIGFLVLAVLVVLGVIVSNLRRTNLGRRMLAVRSNERAAAGSGVDVRHVKLVAFGIGSLIAGVAGTMAAYTYGSVSADNYDAVTALGIIAFAYIGGITTVTGAVIAAMISTQALIPYALQRFANLSGTWALLAGGVLLIFNLIFYPDGVAGALRKKSDLRKQRGGGFPRPGFGRARASGAVLVQTTPPPAHEP